MKCAYCDAMIDDDSVYCDQCGEEILLCPVCGKPGKGKRCIYDGNALVSATEQAAGGDTKVLGAAAGPGPGPAAGSTAGAVAGAPAGGGTIRPGATPATIRISSKEHGVELEVAPGSVVGRKSGELTDFFGRFDTVSGTHARFDRTDSQWSVTDLGSTNGTYLNERTLSPQEPAALEQGARLRFAELEFTVAIDPPEGQAGEGGTVRLTR